MLSTTYRCNAIGNSQTENVHWEAPSLSKTSGLRTSRHSDPQEDEQVGNLFINMMGTLTLQMKNQNKKIPWGQYYLSQDIKEFLMKSCFPCEATHGANKNIQQIGPENVLHASP